MIAKYMQFETYSLNLSTDYEIYDKMSSLSQKTDKLKQFEKQLKNLLKILGQIQANFQKGSSRDAKEKVTKCQQKYSELKKRLQKYTRENQDQIQRQRLFNEAKKQEQPTAEPNAEGGTKALQDKMDTAFDYMDNINRGANELHRAHVDIAEQLNDQGQIIRQAGRDVDTIQQDVTTVDRIVRMVKNQNLFNKILLLSLAGFLSFADLVLLVLKIT